jgi:hypothetical protein
MLTNTLGHSPPTDYWIGRSDSDSWRRLGTGCALIIGGTSWKELAR